MRTSYEIVLAAAFLSPLMGCASTQNVRYVYQDHQYGVIGMPENTDHWPTRYRKQAEALMDRHFPEGHEIVRAEEVTEGTRTLTVQGTNSVEVAPQLPTALLQIGALGRRSSRSQADKLKIKECRIIYRRATHGAGPASYAELETLGPTQYIDPNDEERHKDKDARATAKDEKKRPRHSAEKHEIPKTDEAVEVTSGAENSSND